MERSRDLLMTGNGDGNGQQIGGDGTGDSTFNTIAQEDQEHQDELKKYLDRLDAMWVAKYDKKNIYYIPVLKPFLKYS